MKRKNETNNTLIIVIVAILVLTLFSGVGGMMGYGFMGPGMMYGYYGSGFSFAWIFMLIYLVALVLLIIWLVKQLQK